jgi:imidazolonepropionase-like amidohydrolase
MALHVKGVLLPEDEVRDLWLDGDRVTFDPVPGADTVSRTGFILPGLVDAHCHIGIRPGGGPISDLNEARQLAAIDRAAGTLTIRDAGSPFPYAELDDDPDVPRLIRAGRHVAPIRRYLRDIGVEVADADLPATLAEQAKAGTGWVKLVGDWIDREIGDLAPAFEPAAVAAGIEAAHAAGAKVAVHTFSEEAVATLVRAGVDSVEHGTGLSVDLIDEMARRGTAFVPTMINIRRFDDIAAEALPKFPRFAAHMRALGAGHPAIVRAAHEAGVPVYVGSDAGGGIAHGMAAREMLLLHELAGMAPLEVLRAGSWGAREWLGIPGLVEGGLADLVVYDRDPREDLTALLEPGHIILRGRVA